MTTNETQLPSTDSSPIIIDAKSVPQSAARTHIGRRKRNEDDFHCEPQLGLFAVADGMGGYEGGEIAAALVVDTLAEFFRRNEDDSDMTWPFALDKGRTFDENLIAVAVRLAHARVSRARVGRLSRMGATVAALVLREGTAVLAHVGDSRIYRLRDGTLERLTRDHSLYAEMEACGADLPPPQEFPLSNVITRAIGMDGAADPEVRSVEIAAGDRYLLCTDGLLERLDDEAIAKHLHAATAGAAADALVDAAYEAGGRDNITALVVFVPQREE
ncbi:MAG: serine/threonine-protein phosphatase [Myxococcales bacterium]|nr:serine/threonine-protein phosphatase [Myxococcales bacterium]